MKLLLIILPAIAVGMLPSVAHDHFAAGILDTNLNGQPDAGEPLQFVGPSGNNKTFHLLARPVGFRPLQRCGGYYMLDERPRTLFPNDAFSIIALSDGQYDLESPGHAHTGSLICFEIVSVSGPPGAKFGFWDQGVSSYSDIPTVSLTTNEATGNPRFMVSEGIDDAADDPFGHIHGRSWTADKPGDYAVGLRLVDLSTTGPGGGPWHPPSQIYIYHFTAGPEFRVSGQQVTGVGLVLTWPSQMGIWAADTNQRGILFDVERSSTLAPGSWQKIGTITGTTAPSATFTDSSPPAGTAFYRLNYLWSVP